MNWQELKIKLGPWMPAIALERSLSHKTRIFLRKIFILLASAALAASVGVFGSPSLKWLSLFYLFILLFIAMVLLEAFFYSYFFKTSQDGREVFGFELSMIISRTNRNDITRSFLNSPYGKLVFPRLGIDGKTLREFLKQRQTKLTSETVKFPQSKTLLDSYLQGLVESDKEFSTFLLSRGVSADMFVRCSRWIMTRLRKTLDQERWWSETNLSKNQGIGRDWSYGKAYFLSRYSSPLRVSAIVEAHYHEEEMLSLESILSKSRESNAVIIGDEGSGKIEVIESLKNAIDKGKSSKALEDKKFIVFETAGFVAGMQDKKQFEESFLRVLKEAVEAGNIVLVIPDFASLIQGAAAYGSDVASLVDSFLASSELQVIAVSNTQDFHAKIESNQALMQRFDTVQVKGGDENQILTVLEGDIRALEYRERAFFTYQAIFEAVEAANRYFVGKPLLDTAMDLLSQAVAIARGRKSSLITKEDVLSLVESKTGVPLGEVTGTEQSKLARLEEFLHKRVIGQNEAIKAISNAMRRARTGITNPNRPMGSFMFLGPTGVGKTETTKALAEMFFGSEKKILRLDMSEYNTADSINRLIGSIGDESGGVLGAMLRETPYGVLLLDEFEKSDRKVTDLFLQILDEGIFSDSLGRKVSARNLIIIATSNAGSDAIFEIIKNGGNIAEKKDAIIEGIIRQGIYRPELLNRFDGVILFHPLNADHLRQVSTLMLQKLAERLKEQGIILIINPILVDFLVEKGSDPKFGARSLNRAMQDTVEKVIADKIISGTVKPGSELVLTDADLKA